MKREAFNNRKYWLSLVTLVAVILGLMMSANVALSENDNAKLGILDHAYGKTHADWSAEWWKWSYTIPADEHPLFDSGDCDCSKGQKGPIWFLGGSLTSDPDPNGGLIANVTRNCTIPPGKTLFFPILNVVGSVLERNETLEELLKFVTDAMLHAKDLYAEIDGVPVQDLEQYITFSAPFIFGPLPENSYLEHSGVEGAVEGATSLAVAGGCHLMLEPLSVGHHTIRFRGKFEFSIASGDPFDFLFKLDITYKIRVRPEKPQRVPPRLRTKRKL